MKACARHKTKRIFGIVIMAGMFTCTPAPVARDALGGRDEHREALRHAALLKVQLRKQIFSRAF
jgi:hypothetical protein